MNPRKDEPTSHAATGQAIPIASRPARLIRSTVVERRRRCSGETLDDVDAVAMRPPAYGLCYAASFPYERDERDAAAKFLERALCAMSAAV